MDGALKVRLFTLFIAGGWMMIRGTIKRAEMPFVTKIHKSKELKTLGNVHVS